jgi:short-subunit dehydrogenase
VKNVINQIVEREGQLDIVIANAGIGFEHKTKLPDFDQSIHMININFLGVVYTFEAALEHMFKQKSGHIVGMASVAGFVGLPGVAAYSSSKSAVIKMCETFALDLPAQGVHCTCIAPGFIDTPLTRKNKHPMPFLMKPDVAARKMVRAIDQKKSFYSIPKPMYFLVRLMEMMPRRIYRSLMKMKSINYGK